MRFRVLSPLMLHPGALLGLTEEQADARRFALAAEGAMWRVLRPVGFKAGEVIDVDDPDTLPKAHVDAMEAFKAKAKAKRSTRAEDVAAPADPAADAEA